MVSFRHDSGEEDNVLSFAVLVYVLFSIYFLGSSQFDFVFLLT